MGGWQPPVLYQTLSDFSPKHPTPPEVELKVPSIGTLALLLLFFLFELGRLTLLVLLAMDLELGTHTVGLLLHGVLSKWPRMAYKASGLSGRV
jgi:hypothetical protein